MAEYAVSTSVVITQDLVLGVNWAAVSAVAAPLALIVAGIGLGLRLRDRRREAKQERQRHARSVAVIWDGSCEVRIRNGGEAWIREVWMDASLEPTRVPVPYGWSTDDVLLTVEPAHVVVDDIPPQDPGARGTVIALRVGEEEDQLGVHWAALPEPYAPVGLDEQTFLQLLPPRMTSGRGYLHHEAVESGTLPKSPKARARYFYEALVGMAKTPEKAVCEAIERIALEFTDTDGIRWRRLANQHEIAELPPLGARP